MSRIRKERLKQGRLFIPILFSFGATLEGLPLETFLNDATKISNSLGTIQNFFHVDGVVCSDRMVLADALGCTIDLSDAAFSIQQPPSAKLSELDTNTESLKEMGRIGTTLDVVQRLRTLLPDLILVGHVTGPLTLASYLTSISSAEVFQQKDYLSFTSKAVSNYVKILGDAGIDGILFSEESFPLLDEKALKTLRRCFSPIWNTAKFYDAFPLLMVENLLPEQMAVINRILDGVVLRESTAPKHSEKGKPVSFALPVSLLEEEPPTITSFLAENNISTAVKSRSLFLLTTESEIPKYIHKEFMIRGIETVRDFLKSG